MLEDLQQFGLSEKESAVYMASLEIGRATADQLSKHSGVNRSTTYVQIEELMKLGLMSTHEEGKKTYFHPESPDHLQRLFERRRERIEQQEQHLKKIMPDLDALFSNAGERPKVRFFEGKQGLLTMREETLKTKDKELLIASSNDHMEKVFTEEELTRLSKKRSEKNIYPKVMYTKTGEDITPVPPIEMKRIDAAKFPFHADVYIYGDTVALASLEGSIVGVIIENKAIANSMRSLFFMAWNCL